MLNLLDQEKSIARVLRAIESLKSQGMVIMVDEEDRENEGDIVFAAESVDADKINFMSRYARGLICLALEPQMIDRLKLPMMQDASKASCARNTAFTVSIEAREGVTTGISAHDRAQTIRVAVADAAKPEDLVVPGHIFPLRARRGGVLERAGHTEGSVDLAKLAGLKGAAVICEIMNDDGSMARRADLEKLAAKFELPMVSLPDLISYRLLQESLVEIESRRELKTSHGDFTGVTFSSKIDGSRHFALVKGENFKDHVVDVRVHIQRPVVDVFGASDGARYRIEQGMQALASASHGVFVYLLRPLTAESLKDEMAELSSDLKGDSRQQVKLDSAVMDQRQIGVGSQILRALGVRRMRVLSSSPKPYKGLSGFGLEVIEHKLLRRKEESKNG